MYIQTMSDYNTWLDNLEDWIKIIYPLNLKVTHKGNFSEDIYPIIESVDRPHFKGIIKICDKLDENKVYVPNEFEEELIKSDTKADWQVIEIEIGSQPNDSKFMRYPITSRLI
jgi:hypothetical protein